MGIVTFQFDRLIKADRFNVTVSFCKIENLLKRELGEVIIITR